MRPLIPALFCLVTTACSSSPTCERMAHRLKAIENLCRGMSATIAKSQCEDEAEPMPCEAVIAAKVTIGCQAQAGKDRVEWAIADFCD